MAPAKGCRRFSPLDPIATAPVTATLMLPPPEAFTRRPIVFMDHYAGARGVFMPDATVPALAILIANYGGRGSNGGELRPVTATPGRHIENH